jgi:hypothetical protein
MLRLLPRWSKDRYLELAPEYWRTDTALTPVEKKGRTIFIYLNKKRIHHFSFTHWPNAF